MTIEYDREADAIYIHLRNEPFVSGHDISPDQHIDYGLDGRPIGIELLNVSLGVSLDGLPEQGAVAALLLQQGIRIHDAPPHEVATTA